MKPQTFVAVAGVLLLAALGLMLSRRPQPAVDPASQANAASHAFTAIGEGAVRVKPDMAYLRFTLESVGPSSREAEARNQTAWNDLADQLGALHILPEDVRQVHTDLGRFTPLVAGGRQGTYRSTWDGEVTVRNLTQLGQVADAIVSVGPVRLQGVAYSLASPERAKQDAIAKAVENARQRADALATAAGTKVRTVVSVTLLEAPTADTAPGSQAPHGFESTIHGDIAVRAKVQATFST